MTTALDYAREHATRFRQEFADLLSIPSVSTLPERAGDVERAAWWIAADMRRIGLTRVELFRREWRHPLVYGEWLGAGPDAPTVLVYSHYDVQPAEVEDGWDTEPFMPTEIDGKLFARGAVDSKAHVVANLKAVESMLSADDAPANVKFLYEGEEESNSEFIFDFVAANPDLLRADVVVISDGSMPDPAQPALVYGLRGIITLDLIVDGPVRDLHSGHYGGTVHNPIQALTEILAALHDADGRVAVPGFYDAVRPLDEAELAALAEAEPWMAAEWEAFTGATARWGEPEFGLHARIGARPTLEINGIAGGFAGPGFKTVIPARARAKVSCRLVPDQDPADIFAKLQARIADLTPPGITAALSLTEAGAPGVILPRDSAAMRAAARAYELGWGRAPIYLREGGSVPVVDAFRRALDAEIVPLSFGYKGGGAHSPNEYMILDMFDKGIQTAIHFYHQLAEG
jgi:acetylornithine deacetylase/succinyl-diaminopimelate desuccinylase-like protein